MRKHYLDNIRWFTVFVVVLYHVFYMYNAEGISGTVGKITGLEVQYYDLFQYIVYPWIMMLLFVVSGIASRLYLEKHSDKEFIKSRTTKLLVPSTIGLVAFQFIQGYINASISGVLLANQELPLMAKIIISILSGIGVLWYIQILWIFSVLLVLVRKIEKNRLSDAVAKIEKAPEAVVLVLLVFLGGLVWLSSLILNTPLIVVYRFGLYGLVFFLGYFLFSQERVISVLKKYFPLFSAVALILGTVFCILYFGKNYADKPVNRSPLFALYGWFTCLALFGIFSRFFDFENGFTRWVSKRSFGLYVFHYLGISAFALFIAKPGLVPPVAAYILTLLSGLASGFLLYEIISRLPFFKWAVLGIKKSGTDVQKNEVALGFRL